MHVITCKALINFTEFYLVPTKIHFYFLFYNGCIVVSSRHYRIFDKLGILVTFELGVEFLSE